MMTRETTAEKVSRFALNVRYAFRPRKPLLVARLVYAVIMSYVFKRPPLRYVDFAVDFACNLHCEHCFAKALDRKGARTLSPADYADVATQCMRLGTVNFSFQGGEPLLFANLGNLITACRPARNLISVSTNGTMLTEGRIRALKRLGVDILTISLDSADPQAHDRFRGVSGSFEKTLSGIHLALKQGLRVTIGTVVTHHSLRGEGITGLVRLARKLKVLLYFILPVAAGGWKKRTDLYLTDEDFDYIDKLTRRFPYIRTDLQANFGPYGCGAAKEILYLTPYGDVLSCPFLHVSLGNVFKESVEAIRSRALKNRYFSSYHPKCLVSADKTFIDRYLSRTDAAAALPVPWHQVFQDKGKSEPSEGGH